MECRYHVLIPMAEPLKPFTIAQFAFKQDADEYAEKLNNGRFTDVYVYVEQ